MKMFLIAIVSGFVAAQAQGVVTLPTSSKTKTRASAKARKKPAIKNRVQAHAKPLEMRSFRQWKALTHENKQLYLIGLRELIGDLDRLDQSAHIDYQSAKYEWLATLLPAAVAKAQTDTKTCVYAGWVSSFDINGRYCLRPPQGSCSAHQVQCQPLLYGNGKCVASGRSATQDCVKSSKSIADVVKDVAGHEENWEAFRKELTDTCANVKSTQTRVCENLRNRLAQMEIIIGPTAKASTGASTATSPETSPETSEDSSPDSSPDSSANSSSDSSSGETSASPTLNIESAPAESGDGRCAPLQLAQALDGPDNKGNGSGQLAMSMQEAQTLMCTLDPVSESTIKTWQSFIEKRIQASKHFNSAESRYYGDFYQKSFANFKACVSEAKSNRHRWRDPNSRGSASRRAI